MPLRRPVAGPARDRLERLIPLGPVLLAVVFDLWVLRPELFRAFNLNDSAVHLAMIRWAHQRVQHGRTPFDGWFPYLSLGLPLFHYYQSFPHIAAGYLAVLIGTDGAFHWTLYLLLALWPIGVYWAVRLFGGDRWEAAAAAFLAPLLASAPGYGYEHGSYTWRGLGVWAQLWGMWLLGPAWALGWRAVAKRGSPALAGLVIGLTVVCHFLTSYLALLALPLWVVLRPGEFVRRAGRAALVAAAAGLTSAFLIIPLYLDRALVAQSEFNRHTVFRDSFGARKILGWLVTGRLFDQGHLPLVTVLAGVGVLVCLARWRHDERCRAILAVTALSLVLFFGPGTIGPLASALPGHTDLFFHRFIAGVHLGGLLLAGVGAAWIAGRMMLAWQGAAAALRRRVTWAVATAGVLAVAAVCYPSFRERARFDRRGGALIAAQRSAESGLDGVQLDAIIKEIKLLGGGRTYAGLLSNWGHEYTIGYTPVFAVLLADDVDAIGFSLRTTSLSSDPEARFDETNPLQYQALNIRFLILPADRPPPVTATLLDRKGRHTLGQVGAATSYLQLADTAGIIHATRANIGVSTAPFLASRSTATPFPQLVLDGAPNVFQPVPTDANLPPPGLVRNEVDDPAAGDFHATVTARRAAVLLLSATYSPRWRVEVDGIRVRPTLYAPSLVGREIPAGTHTVSFHYVPFRWSGELIVLALVGLVLLEVGHRRLRRRASPPDRAPAHRKTTHAAVWRAVPRGTRGRGR